MPGGFIPDQDKQYLIAIAQLPPAATLDRTDEVVRKIGEIAHEATGCRARRAVQWHVRQRLHAELERRHRILLALEDFDKRTTSDKSAKAIAQAMTQKLSSIQDAFIVVVPPPPVIGLGTLGGFKLQIEDRADLGAEALYAATQEAIKKAYQDPALVGTFSTYQINVPQLNVDVDRVKVKRQNVKLSDLFDTLNVYLGSLYVNDFNKFGRTYQVLAQADAPFRSHVEDILPAEDPQRELATWCRWAPCSPSSRSFRTGCRAAVQRLSGI